MIPATDKESIRRIMKHIVWDYDIDPYELYEVVTRKREKAGHFDVERVFIRMLERLSWYDLLDLLGVDALRGLLSHETVSKIRLGDVREKYEYVGKILQGKAVPFSGWDPESREKIRGTLLSHRWYRAREALVRT
jgi:hypothetical protein